MHRIEIGSNCVGCDCILPSIRARIEISIFFLSFSVLFDQLMNVQKVPGGEDIKPSRQPEWHGKQGEDGHSDIVVSRRIHKSSMLSFIGSIPRNTCRKCSNKSVEAPFSHQFASVTKHENDILVQLIQRSTHWHTLCRSRCVLDTVYTNRQKDHSHAYADAIQLWKTKPQKEEKSIHFWMEETATECEKRESNCIRCWSDEKFTIKIGNVIHTKWQGPGA